MSVKTTFDMSNPADRLAFSRQYFPDSFQAGTNKTKLTFDMSNHRDCLAFESYCRSIETKEKTSVMSARDLRALRRSMWKN